MRYTILFVLALILVSGFIAYFGDLLGRRMGKKRLTLFGLRPRHTAIIVTTITGMLISALALFALISANSQFREVLTRHEQILAQSKRLSTTNANLERMNEALLKRSGELTRQVTLHQEEVDAALEEVRKATNARDKAEAAVGRLEKEIAARKTELAQLRTRTHAAESELTAVNAQLGKVRSELKTARSNLTQARDDLSEAQKNLLEAVLRLSDASARLASTQQQLEETEQQLSQRTEELKALKELTAKFAVESAQARGAGFILNQGEEIVRGEISTRQSAAELERALYSLLERASERAAGLGAKIEQNDRAVTVVYRVYSPDGKYAWLIDDEPGLVTEAVDTIRGTIRDVLVQVVCAVNTLPGEQVPVELKLYINKLVFHEGDRIALTKIDGALSEGRILLLLTDFWRNEVSESAVKSGIIPGPRPGPQSTVGGRDPQPHIDELLRVLDRIKETDAEASVAVYAASDIYAADLLEVNNVRFSVTNSE